MGIEHFKIKKILGIVVLGLLLSGNAYAHEDLEIYHKAHEPIKCILPEDRNLTEKMLCEDRAKKHRLCKLDQHCALIKIEELEKENKELKEELEKENKELKEKLDN